MFNFGLHPDETGDICTIPRIAVVGAGVSGIAAAAHIAELGFDCHIFEAGDEDRVGGIWTKVNKTSSLQISSYFYRPHHSVRWSCAYPTQSEIVEQIRGLWIRFGLREKTSFHCTVQSVERVGTKWMINDGSTGLFDGIIAAVGTCGTPRKLSLPDQNLFTGDVVHSTELDKVDVQGKTVTIIGGGASAVEALEYANDHGAAKVKVFSRSHKWMIPRWTALNFILAAVPSGPFTLWALLVSMLLREFFYGKTCSHIAPDHGAEHVYSATPIVNNRALELVRNGNVEWSKADCQRFEKNAVVVRLRDIDRIVDPSKKLYTSEPCDICIQATGFHRPSLSFLERYQGAHLPPNWYMQVFPPGQPTICALNSTWQEAFGSVGGSQTGLFTRLLLTFVIDPATRPSHAEMKDWVDFMVRWNRGLTFVTQIEVFLWLGVAIACNWRLWQWCGFIMFGTGLPSRYRSKS